MYSMTSFDTMFPADSLEFCPHPQFLDIFVCGTYKLLEQDSTLSGNTITGPSELHQKRIGQCLTFQLQANGECSNIAFKQVQLLDLPAILDIKWCPITAATFPSLAIADSEGNISIHEWRENIFTQTDAVRCASTETLVLSIDWSNRRSGEASLVASLSNGSLCILRPTESSKLTITNTWHAHDYEPWVTAWNYWDTNIIYSGGDDLKLKAWDVRHGFDSPVFVNKRFDAGVTSIQSHPHVEHLLAVGSYNNTVKLFDTRKLSIPVTEVEVGGGAWRVKWHPSEIRKHDLLIASMHDGFKVVRFGSAEQQDDLAPWYKFLGPASIINRKDDHESMAYGTDWSYASPLANGETIVGGCSFYDHKMSIWTA